MYSGSINERQFTKDSGDLKLNFLAGKNMALAAQQNVSKRYIAPKKLSCLFLFSL